MKKDPPDPAQPAAPDDHGEMSEAEIDENLEASFPASDPPAWTLGVDENHPHPDVQPEGDISKDD